MKVPKYAQIALLGVFVVTLVIVGQRYMQPNKQYNQSAPQEKNTPTTAAFNDSSGRKIETIADFTLPIKNIVPDQELTYSIPLDEIRQGCSRQDCIPSVDSPEFMSVSEATAIVATDQIGIGLSYKGEKRFYPFSMLVTREIVNDTVAGDALLVTYCPLCGTGIVFDRTIDGVMQEFGVSGMLWQSNLLMYNRDDDKSARNLWSQVLGEAVVGNKTGTQLTVISSDIMQFDAWQKQSPDGLVLTTGSQRDPYDGEYYEIAQRFAPDFNAQTSPLAPDTYVYGIEVDGVFKAYPRDLLPEGEIRDMINGEEVIVTTTDGTIVFQSAADVTITDVEGFWFSWVAAHPETLLWSN